MQYNNHSNTRLFIAFKSQSITISISDNNLFLSFILLISCFLATNSFFDEENDNIVLAFKPTVPSNEEQQQQQQQQSSNQISDAYNFIKKWGSEGTSEGQFKNPKGIAIDSSTGNVFVSVANHRIQVFAPKEK